MCHVTQLRRFSAKIVDLQAFVGQIGPDWSNNIGPLVEGKWQIGRIYFSPARLSTNCKPWVRRLISGTGKAPLILRFVDMSRGRPENRNIEGLTLILLYAVLLHTASYV